MLRTDLRCSARTTPVPTLTELTNLFDALPELPPPVRRNRVSFAEQKKQAQSKTVPPPTVPEASPTGEASLLHRLFAWAFRSPSPQAAATTQDRKPNPFAVLKQGKKMIVIAAVDAGMISFFSFRQGCFEAFPMA